MLTFLRKHQKIIFAIAGVLVIFSMSFFGVSSGREGVTEQKNTVLGVAVDGSKLNSIEMDEIARFIGYASTPGIALLSIEEDVLSKDFFDSGLGRMLIGSYYEELKEELTSKLETYDRYRPYQHPEVSFISAQNLWSYYAPEINGELSAFKRADDPMEKVEHLIGAYLAQAKMPEELLRQFLYFQERQAAPRVTDPYIERGSLALFNVRSSAELLGGKFLQMSAQFIHNTSLLAKQKGYKVSMEEARASLMEHAKQAYQEVQGVELADWSETRAHLKNALRQLHLSDKRGVKIWQKVLLCRRLFEGADNSVFVDSLAYDQVNRYSKEILDLEVYTLPNTLAIHSFDDMMKFELYLDQVAKRKASDLVPLPEQFLSVDRIRSRCPKLLAMSYDVEVAELSKRELAMRVALRDIAEYQINQFDLLKESFPELGLVAAHTIDDKLVQLDRIDPLSRSQIDAFARDQILAQHGEWIEEELAGKEGLARTIRLNVDDTNDIFENFEDNNKLMSLLDRAYADSQAQGAAQSIDLIGEGETYYRVKVLGRGNDFEVMTFAQADRLGALDRLLTERLEREYPNVRSQRGAMFKNASGEYRPLAEVREDVGRFVFSDAIAQLQDYLKGQEGAPSTNLNALDMLASYRFHHFMADALNSFRGEAEAARSKYLSEEDALESQFRLVANNESVSRSRPTALTDDQIFRMKENEWSTVSLLAEHGIGFFHVDSKRLDDEHRKVAMAEGRALLIKEARRVIFQELLSDIQAHNAIKLEPEGVEA